MILIKSIETVICPDNVAEIFYNKKPYHTIRYNSPQTDRMIEVTSEMVHGSVFTNVNGESIIIGMAEDVKKYIGLPFEAFDNQLKKLETAQITISQLKIRRDTYKKRLHNFNNLNFFKKVLFLIKNRFRI